MNGGRQALTDEQALLTDLVGGLVDARVAPVADAVDEREQPDGAVVAGLGDHGLLAVDVPAELGGSGADLRAVVLVVAGVARASAALAAVPAVTHAVAAAYVAGDGPAAGAFDAGSSGTALADATGGAAEAVADGDGWRLTGHIGRVEAPLEPERMVILFETRDGSRACVLDAHAPGVEVGAPDRRTGLRGAATRALTLDSAAVRPVDLIGAEASVAAARQHRLLTTAGRANGVARAAVDAAARYLGERRQFGVRLADMAGLRAMAARAAARLGAAEAALWELAGRPDALAPGAEGACAGTALVCVETAVAVSTDALQLHGGYGYTHDFPLERFLRDALSLRASIGGSRTALDAAATGLLGPAGV